MILFGHPTGNPNSHHAALAHFETGRLAAFCVPWFPGSAALLALSKVPGMQVEAARLARRRFEPLADVPKIEGRAAEWWRLMRRAVGAGSEKSAYEANDWLMKTMVRAARRPAITAVHSYEDCSLLQFQQAKRLGKKCIYDMPIGYYPWWDEKQKQLARDYAEWVPSGSLPASRHVRQVQKIQEMELADVVLVACRFVEKTIREFYPDKKIALAPYGVDTEFWSPGGEDEETKRQPSLRDGLQNSQLIKDEETKSRVCETARGTAEGKLSDQETKRPRDKKTKSEKGDKIRFIYAGQSSIRKGTPVLIEAWEKAGLRDAELLLVGSWQLADDRLKRLPPGVRFVGPVGPERLRDFYRESDVFVFPSFFEGFGLVILEAMACGLPVIASDRSAAPDVLDDSCGRLVQAGKVEQLTETLRWCSVNRGKLDSMGAAAHDKAVLSTWTRYRSAVSRAVDGFR